VGAVSGFMAALIGNRLLLIYTVQQQNCKRPVVLRPGHARESEAC